MPRPLEYDTDKNRPSARMVFTNAALSDSMAHDMGLYYVASVKGTTIKIEDDVEIVVSTQDCSNNVSMQYGGRPRVRSEIQNGLTTIPQSENSTRHLLSVGAFFTLEDEAGEQVVPLLRRNGPADEVPHTGKITNQSGLVSEDPLTALYKRTNEELGIVHLRPEDHVIEVLVVGSKKEIADDKSRLMGIVRDNKYKNEEIIRQALAQQTGDDTFTASKTTKDADGKDAKTYLWRMVTVPAPAEFDFTPAQQASGFIKDVTLEGFKAPHTVSCHMHVDHERFTTTLTMPLNVKLPNGWSTQDIYHIDPQGFGRETFLPTPQAVLRQPHCEEVVPSLAAYLKDSRKPAPVAPAIVPVLAPVAI